MELFDSGQQLTVQEIVSFLKPEPLFLLVHPHIIYLHPLRKDAFVHTLMTTPGPTNRNIDTKFKSSVRI